MGKKAVHPTMYYIGWTVFFMDRKLKRWEVALLCGVLAALLWSAWAGQEQAELAGQVIRLHVLANSDSQADQELKLAVRDRVLEQAEDLYPEDATLEQAREILEDNLDELAAAGQQVVDEAGKDYLVTAQLEECWFPTKEYENFALPARRIYGTAGRDWRGRGTELVVRSLSAPVPGSGHRERRGGHGGGALYGGSGPG